MSIPEQTMLYYRAYVSCEIANFAQFLYDRRFMLFEKPEIPEHIILILSSELYNHIFVSANTELDDIFRGYNKAQESSVINSMIRASIAIKNGKLDNHLIIQNIPVCV